MGSSSDQKAQLRKQALAERDHLPDAVRIEAALSAGALAGDLLSAAIVGGYWPIRSEFDPRPVMQALADGGARLALPAVLDDQTIVFRELIRGGALVPAGFGTMAPDETAAILQPDLLLMPLAAVDGAGNRIGYGAGFYDRYISRAQVRPKLVGLAFDAQRFDAIAAEAHDQPLDGLLTETGLHIFGHK
ncbi:MAG: 5-formyltetrahydrofolate cyclo-ligase [Pseudomonadota bacterium]